MNNMFYNKLEVIIPFPGMDKSYPVASLYKNISTSSLLEVLFCCYKKGGLILCYLKMFMKWRILRFECR